MLFKKLIKLLKKIISLNFNKINIKIMSDQNKDKGVYKELVEFLNSSRIFLINCQKPDKKGIILKQI